MINRDEFIEQVFKCAKCKGRGLPFEASASGKYYRFPPTIGATGPAPLLFVGINPRVSETNRDLHDGLVDDLEAFRELSRNRVDDCEYIAAGGERHYVLHLSVADALFPDQAFEAVAAVTELHFCASATSVGLPADSSRCANAYFASTLGIVSPKVVFAVGKHVLRTLRSRTDLRESRNPRTPSPLPLLIQLPHPSAFGPKLKLMEAAIEIAREELAREV